MFQKHGSKISFFGRLLPAIRTYVSLPAGIGKSPFKKFMLYTFAGSLIWNVLLVYAGVLLGENWKNIDKYSPILDVIAVAVGVGLVIWFIRGSRRYKNENNSSLNKV